jgi:hypothetical protein
MSFPQGFLPAQSPPPQLPFPHIGPIGNNATFRRGGFPSTSYIWAPQQPVPKLKRLSSLETWSLSGSGRLHCAGE